jgi:hypothetical protein
VCSVVRRKGRDQQRERETVCRILVVDFKKENSVCSFCTPFFNELSPQQVTDCVRLSALCDGHALLPRNIISVLLRPRLGKPQGLMQPKGSDKLKKMHLAQQVWNPQPSGL